MRIALAQMCIAWEEKEKNLICAESLIVKAANDGIDIIFFSEMSFTGFSMNTRITGETDCYTVGRIMNIARENNISIGFGWVRRKDDKFENVYTVIDSSGNKISEYVKIHPFSYSEEDNYFVGGDSIEIADYNGLSFSTFICYDLRFPETFRAIANKVHMIIVPACWPAKRAEHWKTLLKARAIENQVYIVAINCQGNIGGLYYSGDSCVINPNGDVVTTLTNKCGVLVYDFSDDVNEYRKNFPVLKDIKVINKIERGC